METSSSYGANPRNRRFRQSDRPHLLTAFAAKEGDIITHDALSGYASTAGKLSVPYESIKKFYTEVVQIISTGSNLSLCVKVTPRFSLFFDIEKDVYLEEITAKGGWDEYLKLVSKIMHAKLLEYYPQCELLVLCRALGGADAEGKVSIGIHIYTRRPAVVVDLSTAKELVTLLVIELNEKIPPHPLSDPWLSRFDISVYCKGLRLPWCRKVIPCPKCMGQSDANVPLLSRQLKRKNSNGLSQRNSKKRKAEAQHITEEVMTVCAACKGTKKVDIGRVYEPVFSIDVDGNIVDQVSNPKRMSKLDVFLQFANVRIEAVGESTGLTKPIKPIVRRGLLMKKIRSKGIHTEGMEIQRHATEMKVQTGDWKPIPVGLQKLFASLIMPSIHNIKHLGDTLTARAQKQETTGVKFAPFPYKDLQINKIITSERWSSLAINVEIGPGSKHCANRWIQDKREHRQNHIGFRVCLQTGNVSQTCFSLHCTKFRYVLLALSQQTVLILRKRTLAEAQAMIQSLKQQNEESKHRSKFYVADEEEGNEEVHQSLNRTASQLSRLKSLRAMRKARREGE